MDRLVDLDAYAAEHPNPTGGRPCYLCNLPINTRETIREAKGRYSAAVIRGWLIDTQNADPNAFTKNTVANHMREHVR